MLPKPNTQEKMILYRLITTKKGIAERDTVFNMFRGHISNLRKSLSIQFTDVPFVNQFGRPGKYRRHWLTDKEKKKAIKLYKSMFHA